MNAAPEGQIYSVCPITELDKPETGSTLLQSELWGRFKKTAGWTPKNFKWSCKLDSVQESGYLLVLEKKIYSRFTMAYIPHGPELRVGLDARELSGLLTGLAGRLKNYLSLGCFVIRFDLACLTKDTGEALLPPLSKASYRVQPPDTVILSLKESADVNDLLTGMHKKTRYNIRLANRNGIKIHRFSGQEAVNILPIWYNLYRETGMRDGISLHPEEYYCNFLAMAGQTAQLYMAEYNGEFIAGIIVARSGHRVTYMYGASSSIHRKQMPNYLLQWQAIVDAFNAGATEYDFFGIPPTSDPGHPMHGLWRFKTGFGGKIVHYPGAWDYPLRNGVYRIYSMAEKVRAAKAVWRKKNRNRGSTG